MGTYGNRSYDFIIPPVCLFEEVFGQEKLVLVGKSGNMELINGVLGSGSLESDMWIESSYLSRKHCLLKNQGKTWWIEDLDTTNGTWVNGRRLNPGEPMVIRENDQIRMADLIFVVKRKKQDG